MRRIRLLLVALVAASSVQAADAAGTRRIMVFGDSVAWGWIPQADGFPSTRYPADVRWPGSCAPSSAPATR